MSCSQSLRNLLKGEGNWVRGLMQTQEDAQRGDRVGEREREREHVVVNYGSTEQET